MGKKRDAEKDAADVGIGSRRQSADNKERKKSWARAFSLSGEDVKIEEELAAEAAYKVTVDHSNSPKRGCAPLLSLLCAPHGIRR